MCIRDSGSTAYVLSMSISNENATQVYLDGVYQSKNNYSTSGSTLTFSTAPPNGTAIEVVHIKAVNASSLNQNNFTGNGSTTQNITGYNFQPDWVWIKSRSSGSGHHSLVDSVRGDMALNSDQNIAQYGVSAFNINDDNSIDVPHYTTCLLYTSPSPRDRTRSRMPSSA